MLMKLQEEIIGMYATNMDKKKIYIIIGIAVSIIILAILLFFLLGKESAPNGLSVGSETPFGTPGASSGNSGFSPNGLPIPAPNEEFVVAPGQTFSKLRQISASPSSGSTIFMEGSTTRIRFLEKATGNVYETTDGSTNLTRITNTTIPKVEEVLWGPKGESLILRYEKDAVIESFFAKISTSTATTSSNNLGLKSLEGKFLERNIPSVTVSKNKDKIFYETTQQSGAQFFTSNFNGEKPLLVWQFPIKDWVTRWLEGGTVSLTTKASGQSEGFLYFFNTKTKSLDRVLGKISGLTTLPSSNKDFVLYSETTGNSFGLFAYSTEVGSVETIVPTSLPEKCVWDESDNLIFYCAVPGTTPPGNYPDDWYLGFVSFSDSIWKYNLDTGETKQVGDIKNLSDQDIDAFDLQLSPNSDLLTFRNKRDFTLWALSIDSDQ